MQSSQPDTARIVKELSQYVSVSGLSARELREIGWFDFRAFDYPKHGDEVNIAAEALVYVAFGSSGGWNRNTPFLAALFEFLFVSTGYEPTHDETIRLHALLDIGESASKEILDWFQRTFRSGLGG